MCTGPEALSRLPILYNDDYYRRFLSFSICHCFLSIVLSTNQGFIDCKYLIIKEFRYHHDKVSLGMECVPAVLIIPLAIFQLQVVVFLNVESCYDLVQWGDLIECWVGTAILQ